MDIKNARDFAKILTLCRKQGVSKLKVTEDSLEFELSDKAPARRATKKHIEAEGAELSTPTDSIPTEQYTAEQVAFWSSQGVPDDAFQGN